MCTCSKKTGDPGKFLHMTRVSTCSSEPFHILTIHFEEGVQVVAGRAFKW
jgi:hypothetical protein